MSFCLCDILYRGKFIAELDFFLAILDSFCESVRLSYIRNLAFIFLILFQHLFRFSSHHQSHVVLHTATSSKIVVVQQSIRVRYFKERPVLNINLSHQCRSRPSEDLQIKDFRFANFRYKVFSLFRRFSFPGVSLLRKLKVPDVSPFRKFKFQS